MADSPPLRLYLPKGVRVSVMPRKEYEAFAERFSESVRDELEEHRMRRLRSEEAARRHLVY